MSLIISVDVGTQLTKIVEAIKGRGGLKIISLRYFKTPYQDPEAIDDTAFFEQLFDFFPSQVFKSAAVAVSIPASNANYAVFELPPMPAADLKRAALSEAKRVIQPSPTKGDIINFVSLKATGGESSGELSVFAGAAAKEAMLNYYSLFKSQGITVDYLGVTPSSLAVYASGCMPDMPRHWAFVDIGYKNTTIVICTNGLVALVRNISFAASDFIQAIVTHKKVEANEALDIFLRGESADLTVNNWNYLVGEIRRSLAYYKEISGGNIIDAICFSGGIMGATSAFERLEKSIGGRITLFDLGKLKNLSLDSSVAEGVSSNSFMFATAVSSILCMEARTPVLNFLPVEAIKERTAKKVKLISVKLSLVGVIVLAVVFVSLFLRTQVLKAKLSSLSKEFSQQEYTIALTTEKAINTLEQQVSKQKDFLELIAAAGATRYKVLEVIGKYIPSNVYLNSAGIGKAKRGGRKGGGSSRGGSRAIKVQPDEWKKFYFEGIIEATLEDAQQQLELFKKKLNRSGIFSYISIDWPEVDNESFNPLGYDITFEKEREFNLEVELKEFGWE